MTKITKVNDFVYKSDRLTATIEQDSDCANPREDFGHECIMICFHKKYKLGDDNHNITLGSSWEDIKEQIEKEYPKHTIKPLYMYDHSGIVISMVPFSCIFDSGQIGFIVCSNDTENIEEAMKYEVYEYNKYLSGDVWGYTIKKDEDVIDSCWSFFGLNHIQNEVENMLEYWETQEL